MGFSSSDAPVSIAAHACITPFGATEQTWQALLAGRLLDADDRVDRVAGGPCRTIADAVPQGLPRATALALIAADEALSQATDPHVRSPDIALLIGTSKGTIDAWLAPAESTFAGYPPAGGLTPALLSDIALELATRLGITGPRLTFSAACASGLLALVRALLLIRSGMVRRALVVATESSFDPLLLASYRRLGVLAPPGYGCRPFDRTRRGFFVSEAAAAVLLVATPGAISPGPLIDGFALGSDAASITAASPDGAVLRSLLRRTIDGRGVDLVHAHGTGTELNDPAELAAIESALPASATRPALYSHKAALGHTLGASGLLSVVLNCLCHRDGIVPPNPRTTDPLPARKLMLGATSVSRPIRRSLAIAAGFGGSTAVVALGTGHPA